MKDLILASLKEIILERVEEKKLLSHNDGAYPGYVHTFRLSDLLGFPSVKIRSELIKLEKEGLVKADRSYKNSTGWALAKLEGFEDHKYRGYIKEVEC